MYFVVTDIFVRFLLSFILWMCFWCVHYGALLSYFIFLIYLVTHYPNYFCKFSLDRLAHVLLLFFCIILLHAPMLVQFSPLTNRVMGVHEGRFSRDPLQVFCAGGHCEQFWHKQGCPLFDVAHPAFPLPTMASFNVQRALKESESSVFKTTLQGALKNGFGEAFMAYDMP